MQHDPVRWFEALGVSAEDIRATLAVATAHGCDDADLYFEHTTSTSVGMMDRKVNRASTSVDLGMGVRVVVQDQVGFAYTEDLSRASLLEAARTASLIARYGTRSGRPISVGSPTPSAFYPVTRDWAEVSVLERVPYLRRWEAEAFSLDPRIAKVQASLSDADKWVLIARADGLVVGDYRPMTQAAVSCTAIDGSRREAGGYNVSARRDLGYYDEQRQTRMVREAVGRAVGALSAGDCPAGEMPVVLAAGSSGILLHEAIGHGMEADFNRKGISIYADKLGKRIAPPGVTVVDDATLPGARGSLNVDDEGSPTERTTLVRDGVLTSYLHDRISARAYGVPSTGSGRRESFRHPVLPRMRSTYLEPGTHTADEIVGSVHFGLLAETFANGQVQIGAGDFSFYVRSGWLIEDGRKTRPVKDVNLIGNGPAVLEAIEMVGDDLVVDEGGWTCGKDGQSVPVSQGMPTVRVGRLSVGGGRG